MLVVLLLVLLHGRVFRVEVWKQVSNMNADRH